MIKTLNKDPNLQGYCFEYISKILLRRNNKNNFIFQANIFDSIEEVIDKYRLKITNNSKDKIELLRNNWKKFDIIEFKLDNSKERNILNIVLYDVKTKNKHVKRDYFESCISNHDFALECKNINLELNIVSIILFENWSFSFSLFDYFKANIRTYSRFKPKQQN